MARPGQEAVTTLKEKLPAPNLPFLKEAIYSKQHGFPFDSSPTSGIVVGVVTGVMLTSVKDSDAGMLNTDLVASTTLIQFK